MQRVLINFLSKFVFNKNEEIKYKKGEKSNIERLTGQQK